MDTMVTGGMGYGYGYKSSYYEEETTQGNILTRFLGWFDPKNHSNGRSKKFIKIISRMRVSVTGGAGFIGSNLVENLVADQHIERVRVLDNLATGSIDNVEEFNTSSKFEFIQADIRDYSACLNACDGIDILSHQAALGSVPRSINDPITTNEVNITGTLNVFTAAKEKKN
jgi:FlaA1/EpsC-like NDP-sugar epimerase